MGSINNNNINIIQHKHAFYKISSFQKNKQSFDRARGWCRCYSKTKVQTIMAR